MATPRPTRDKRIELRVDGRAGRYLLSERASARVLKLLEDPPKPTPALLATARRRASEESFSDPDV